jgi:hypothetical protein
VGGHRRRGTTGRVVLATLGTVTAVVLGTGIVPGCTREEQTPTDAFCVDVRRLDDTTRSLDSTRDPARDLQLVRHRFAQLPDDAFRASAGVVVRRYVDNQAGIGADDISEQERAELRAAFVAVSEVCTDLGHDVDLTRPYSIE